MRIAQALRDLFGERTQATIAEELTAAGLPVDQTKVSRWLRGATEPRLAELAAVEDAVGKPRGWILARAGYVAMPGVDPLTPPDASGEPGIEKRVSDLEHDVAAILEVLRETGAMQEAATNVLEELLPAQEDQQ